MLSTHILHRLKAVSLIVTLLTTSLHSKVHFTTMADASSFGIVTVWTAACFDTDNGKYTSTGNIGSGCYFVSEDFTTSNAVGLSKYLKK
jgi:hypothetical protein